MLNKLSFRNAKRSVKDYLVYIITMTIISSLMFAFNGLLFSASVRDLLNEVTSIAVFIGLATFFVVVIVIWLTKYIINFMLERRSKEFGTYLLIGMDKKAGCENVQTRASFSRGIYFPTRLDPRLFIASCLDQYLFYRVRLALSI